MVIGNTRDLFDIPPGMYECIITDSNGCTYTLTVEVRLNTSLNELVKDINLSISPNPTSGLVDLSYELPRGMESVQWSLIDLKGRHIMQGLLERGGRTLSLDLTDYPVGWYQLQVRIKEGSGTLGILKK